MREQLIRYVELLFAGAENAGDIQQEILQNTLDRYDDLIAQGKTPEAAYRLAISGIGDINEILGSAGGAAPKATGAVPQPVQKGVVDAKWQPLLRVLSIVCYILCPLPLFLIQDEAGLCLLLVMVALGAPGNAGRPRERQFGVGNHRKRSQRPPTGRAKPDWNHRPGFLSGCQLCHPCLVAYLARLSPDGLCFRSGHGRLGSVRSEGRRCLRSGADRDLHPAGPGAGRGAGL